MQKIIAQNYMQKTIASMLCDEYLCTEWHAWTPVSSDVILVHFRVELMVYDFHVM